MGCISHQNLCPSSGDTENVLLQKILQSVNAGGGVAGVSSISLNGGPPQTGAVSISTGGTVTSVNGDPGPAVSLDSGEIPEGATNFYYTAARFNTSFAAKTTADLAELTNLYFTVARVRATDLTGLVATAGVVAATDTILQAFGKVAGTTNNLLNFRDSGVGGHADASIFINSGATEIVTVQGADSFIRLASERLQRNITSGKLALLGGTSKGTGAFVEAHGDTSASVGLVSITTKGRITGTTGFFQIFNNDIGSAAGDLRAQMGWEGSWSFSPVWNDGAVTFVAHKINLTDTASAAASLLADFQVASASKWKVGKTGIVTQTGSLNINGGTITAMEPIIDLTRTWNNAGVSFTSIRMNITNTASAATSRLIDLQIGGVTRFAVSNTQLLATSGAAAAAPGLSFVNDPDTGFWNDSANSISFVAGGLYSAIASSTYFWAYTPLVIGTTSLTYLREDAAGILAQRNTTNAQTFRWYETGDAGIANYSRTTVTTQAGNHLIRTEAGGTGTLRILQVGTGPKVGTDIAGANAIFHGGQSTGTGAGGSALIQVSPAGGAGAGVNALVTRIEASNTGLGFFAVAPVARQVSAANLTNNVTAGGTDDTIANYTDLVVYANDAAAIRNDIYQLARKLKQVNDALRLYGLLT